MIESSQIVTANKLLASLTQFDKELAFCCQLYNHDIYSEMQGHLHELRRLLRCIDNGDDAPE